VIVSVARSSVIFSTEGGKSYAPSAAILFWWVDGQIEPPHGHAGARALPPEKCAVKKSGARRGDEDVPFRARGFALSPLALSRLPWSYRAGCDDEDCHDQVGEKIPRVKDAQTSVQVEMTDEDARRILRENDRRVKAVMDVLRGKVRDLLENQPRADDTFEIVTDFERKSGVVRYDHLIVAIHLMTAKLMFHVVPDHWRDLLAGAASNFVTRVSGKAAAIRASKKIPGAGQIITVLQGAFSIPSRLLWQAKAERDIRKACEEFRRQINAAALTQANRKGRVRDVMTRLPRPRFSRRFKGCKSR